MCNDTLIGLKQSVNFTINRDTIKCDPIYVYMHAYGITCTYQRQDLTVCNNIACVQHVHGKKKNLLHNILLRRTHMNFRKHYKSQCNFDWIIRRITVSENICIQSKFTFVFFSVKQLDLKFIIGLRGAALAGVHCSINKHKYYNF